MLPILALILTSCAALPMLAQQVLLVRQVSLTSPARPGRDATIVVGTAPNAACTIAVLYMSGPSRAQGLVPEMADAQGKVAWTWRVGTRITASILSTNTIKASGFRYLRPRCAWRLSDARGRRRHPGPPAGAPRVGPVVLDPNRRSRASQDRPPGRELLLSVKSAVNSAGYS